MYEDPKVEILEDIKQFFVFAQPCGQLSDHIEFFAESSYENMARQLGGKHLSCKMFQSYTPTFFINLTGPYSLKLHDTNYLIKQQQDILIFRDSPVQRFNSVNDNIFTVKFYPGALKQLLGITSANTEGPVTFLNTILPQQLLSEIRKAATFENRVTILSEYLLKNYGKKTDFKLRLVYDAITCFKETEMVTSNEEIARELNISSKTLNRYFLNEIGVAPKKYFSMIRFRVALENYVKNRETFHPFNYGYYDHSHFGKEMARFTGKN